MLPIETRPKPKTFIRSWCDVLDVYYESLKAKIHLHFKMTFFNDPFLIKKNVCKYTIHYVQIHYSLRNKTLKKVFHSKHGL